MVYDVVIIGTGPAGVSTAWPLVQAGRSVLLVDASEGTVQAPPEGEYFDLRRHDRHQREWMFGGDLSSWVDGAATSPKLRVPTLRPTFAGFAAANKIETENFAAVGSLASGGLSNAWGCGVARYDRDEMAAFPFPHRELDESFAAVSRRIGLSGRADDDLSGYFGLDEWAEPAPALEHNAQELMRGYEGLRSDKTQHVLRLGRARMALISSDRGDRRACDRSGLCLWGCARRALYSSSQEQPSLMRAGAGYRTGFVANHAEKIPMGWRIHGFERKSGALASIEARRLVLAAGTLATTAIAWRTLSYIERPRRVLSNPTAAFLLLRMGMPGRAPVAGPAFAQLSFSHRPASGRLSHGALFSAQHLPAFEFIKHIPASRSVARSIWRVLNTSTLVGNVFLPASLTRHSAELTRGGVLRITGRAAAELPEAIADIGRDWRKAARRMGFIVMPGSFLVGQLGSDIHYAGTLPMRRNPEPGTTSAFGEISGLPGMFVADAATFPELSAKPHTLTMMAMADRLGRYLSNPSSSDIG
ncbi:GMC oxidoreductase [Bosea sp. UNC402CLCol]|uniref:GMC oxidoreductase n=1 Tax=Bosea sp. UNC402CLCol TaxID=1510531 RepID=UPI00057011D7|nr:GMC oxidoreductase [Bosea sp. UNC402CLCol]